jgi:peptidylprolyl isomerase
MNGSRAERAAKERRPVPLPVPLALAPRFPYRSGKASAKESAQARNGAPSRRRGDKSRSALGSGPPHPAKEVPMPAKSGDTVLVHYTGSLSDGTIFDSSRDGGPLESVLGRNMLLPGLENAILGMKEGDAKTVTIQPDQAYGNRTEERILSLPVSAVSGRMKPEAGMSVQLAMDDGEEFDAVITGIGHGKITLDANHPLAGKALTFELELVEIKR